MTKIESEFQDMINGTKIFCKNSISGFYFPLYKFTIELLFDGYVIPDKYIVLENRILHQYDKIYEQLAERGYMALIEKMLPLCDNMIFNHKEAVANWAVKAGNFDILNWFINRGFELSASIA